MNRFFLVDCNNFYVSCERVFDPTLRNKPVVVLGSNDACVIARSNEAKALGIAMGVPAFECVSLFKKHNVIVFSANFALYGDMSNRVMRIMHEYATNIEIYSVDEAFLWIAPYTGTRKEHQYYCAYGHALRLAVVQNTGIPVSIGIGQTKTLAKVANRLAKKNGVYQGVCDLTNASYIDEILASIDIEDVWGIGHRYAAKLRDNRIENARDFKYASRAWVQKHLTIMGLKTCLELNGVSCISLQEAPKSKQSICVSRSFGQKVNTLAHARQAIASYISCAAAKLRAQQSLACTMTVFAISGHYHDPVNYYTSTWWHMPVATAYTPELIAAGIACIDRLFNPGLRYKKVGVVLTDFIPRDCAQLTITHYDHMGEIESTKKTKSMELIDRINTKWGRNTLFFAAEGIEQPWVMHQAHKSPCFTTNWHELLTISL